MGNHKAGFYVLKMLPRNYIIEIEVKMKKTILFIAFLLFGIIAGNQTQAQSMPNKKDDTKTSKTRTKGPKPEWRSKLFIEGNMGMSFSGNYIQIEVSPVIGYDITDRFSLAAGPIYEFISYKPYSTSDDRVKVNLAGARTFGRFYVIEQLFAHAEYDFLRYKDNFGNKTSANRLPLGAGYHARTSGGGVSMAVMALYDVLYQANKNKPAYALFNDFSYNGWIIRFGVNFHL